MRSGPLLLHAKEMTPRLPQRGCRAPRGKADCFGLRLLADRAHRSGPANASKRASHAAYTCSRPSVLKERVNNEEGGRRPDLPASKWAQGRARARGAADTSPR